MVYNLKNLNFQRYLLMPMIRIDGDYSKINLYLAIQCVENKLDRSKFQNEFNDFKTFPLDETYQSMSYPSCSFYLTQKNERYRTVVVTADLREVNLAIFCSNDDDRIDLNNINDAIIQMGRQSRIPLLFVRTGNYQEAEAFKGLAEAHGAAYLEVDLFNLENIDTLLNFSQDFIANKDKKTKKEILVEGMQATVGQCNPGFFSRLTGIKTELSKLLSELASDRKNPDQVINNIKELAKHAPEKYKHFYTDVVRGYEAQQSNAKVEIPEVTLLSARPKSARNVL